VYWQLLLLLPTKLHTIQSAAAAAPAKMMLEINSEICCELIVSSQKLFSGTMKVGPAQLCQRECKNFSARITIVIKIMKIFGVLKFLNDNLAWPR